MIKFILCRNADPAGPLRELQSVRYKVRAIQLKYKTIYERIELNDNKSAEPNNNGDTHNGEHIEVELERVEHNDNNSAEPNTKGDILQDRVKRVHWAMDNITYGDQEKVEEIEGEEEEIGPPPPQFVHDTTRHKREKKNHVYYNNNMNNGRSENRKKRGLRKLI